MRLLNWKMTDLAREHQRQRDEEHEECEQEAREEYQDYRRLHDPAWVWAGIRQGKQSREKEE